MATLVSTTQTFLNATHCESQKISESSLCTIASNNLYLKWIPRQYKLLGSRSGGHFTRILWQYQFGTERISSIANTYEIRALQCNANKFNTHSMPRMTQQLRSYSEHIWGKFTWNHPHIYWIWAQSASASTCQLFLNGRMPFCHQIESYTGFNLLKAHYFGWKSQIMVVFAMRNLEAW